MKDQPYVQANTNGRLHDAREPSLSPLDRSFLYGDSVYEVVRTYHGVMFAFQEHFRRLQHSARAIGLELPFDESVLLTEIRRTVSAYFEHEGTEPRPELYLRWQISRGGGPIGLDTQLADVPVFVLLARALPAPTEKSGKAKGLNLTIARQTHRNHPRTVNPAWKTGNYLNNVVALREARQRRFDDVVLLNLDGHLTEASTSNLFFVRGKKVYTPPLSDGLLAGVTRGIILQQARQAWDIEISEETIVPGSLDSFEECFLTATTRDIVPVGKIDGISYKLHSRTMTARLQKTFAGYVQDYARRNTKHALF